MWVTIANLQLAIPSCTAGPQLTRMSDKCCKRCIKPLDGYPTH